VAIKKKKEKKEEKNIYTRGHREAPYWGAVFGLA
jgi:hypothetical protein